MNPSRAARASVRSRIAAVDTDIMARIASTDSAALDQVMPRLSRLADHSVLWIAIAAGLAATRSKWSRRAALRGVASVAIASTAANVVAKGLAGRGRPVESAPLSRQLARAPRTTSFPSGHAASAAAFATGVGLEIPALAGPVGALAAAVGASRVVTGMHYPSDVVAGFMLGATAGALTLRWWPRRPAQPAEAARPRHEAPAAPTGQGLVLVMNAGSGTTSPELADELRTELPDARVIVAAEDDFARALRRAAKEAHILGVAGGDGSVNMAAALAVEEGLPLLLIPAGTFNHFAADLGVWSVADALDALRAGDSVLVDVATAGRQPFINTLSTGVYVDLVHAREHLEDRLGKWPAVIVALMQVLRTSRPQELIVDGRRRRLWLLFAGNCGYEPQGTAPSYRPDLADGQLDIRLVDGQQPLARVRLVTAVMLGTLARSRVYRTWTARSLRIATPDGTPVHLAVDGEVTDAEPRLRIFKREKRLLVYRPDRE